MGIRITTLSDNSASLGDYIGEWGLSILVESDESTILLDTGKEISCVHNADSIGFDLSRVDKIILSHGHFDHTGGLREVLRRMKKKVEVIAHPDIWQTKFSLREGEKNRFIGIPFQKSELENLGAEFCYSREPVRIGTSMMTTGEISMVTVFEEVDPALYIRGEGGTLLPDPVMDDQALIIRAARGLIVILGCAHRGVINTLLQAKRIMQEDRLVAVMGGSHLLDASQDRLIRTLAAFREHGVEKFGLCHCTELKAISFLSHHLGDAFCFNRAGSVMEFD